MNPGILIIDDDPGDGELVMIALRVDGLSKRAVIIDNGPEALELLFGLDPAPALVLLDWHLRGMDGLETLGRLRKHAVTKSQPVVIFSSSDGDRERLAAYQAGANGYVRKPVDFVEFGRVVRETARYWLSVNRPPPGRLAAASLRP